MVPESLGGDVELCGGAIAHHLAQEEFARDTVVLGEAHPLSEARDDVHAVPGVGPHDLDALPHLGAVFLALCADGVELALVPGAL